ncbi:MAG: hypothetical protein JW795_06425, partial [Chitinivibrionales bacterium]|nr:hypothetical protein [Chitinivibrionales bacterium]
MAVLSVGRIVVVISVEWVLIFFSQSVMSAEALPGWVDSAFASRSSIVGIRLVREKPVRYCATSSTTLKHPIGSIAALVQDYDSYERMFTYVSRFIRIASTEAAQTSYPDRAYFEIGTRFGSLWACVRIDSVCLTDSTFFLSVSQITDSVM